MKRYIAATAVALLATAGAAAAAVTFDPATGTGFAGKGDLEAALGLRDAQLEGSADAVQFRELVREGGDIDWVCGYFTSPDAAPSRTKTRSETFTGTTIQSVGDSVASADGALSGFNLTGFSGEPTSTAKWAGSKPGSPGFGACPNGPWDLVPGPSAHIGTTIILQVSRNGGHWVDLLTLPS